MSAAAQDVLSAPARVALDELLATPRVQEYATYEGARGRCYEAALTAAIWFRAHGVPVRIVRFVQARVTTPYSREELRESTDDWTAIHRVQLASGITIDLTASEVYHLKRLEQHAVEVEGGVLIDLTWRSWEPESSFPRIATVQEYACDFEVDETICHHCGAGEFEPCVHPSAVVEAAFVRWLTHAEPGTEFVANTYLSNAEKLLAIRQSQLKKYRLVP